MVPEFRAEVSINISNLDRLTWLLTINIYWVKLINNWPWGTMSAPSHSRVHIPHPQSSRWGHVTGCAGMLFSSRCWSPTQICLVAPAVAVKYRNYIYWYIMVSQLSSKKKNIKLKIYKTVILPVILYGCETWTLTLSEEKRLKVFENKVLRKILDRREMIRQANGEDYITVSYMIFMGSRI